jgi:thymidylate synthase (FAD)
MEIIDQYWQFENKPNNVYTLIEDAGRTCWKSEDKKKKGSAEEFIRKIVNKGHTSVLEHANVSVRIITDRGVLAELTRHRIGVAYSVESTRYCNYSKNNQMQFIRPVWVRKDVLGIWEGISEYLLNNMSQEDYMWLESCDEVELKYNILIENGWPPQKARQVLNHSVKTEIVMTANMREWLHVFNLRCSKAAHPQIRELMLNMLAGFYGQWPVIFEDCFDFYLRD